MKRSAYLEELAIPVLETLKKLLKSKDGKILDKRIKEPIIDELHELGFYCKFDYTYSKYEINIYPLDKIFFDYRVKYNKFDFYNGLVDTKYITIDKFENGIYIVIFDTDDFNKLLTDNGKFRNNYNVFKEYINERIDDFKQEIKSCKQEYKLVDQMLEDYNDLNEKIKIYKKTYNHEMRNLFDTNISL